MEIMLKSRKINSYILTFWLLLLIFFIIYDLSGRIFTLSKVLKNRQKEPYLVFSILLKSNKSTNLGIDDLFKIFEIKKKFPHLRYTYCDKDYNCIGVVNNIEMIKKLKLEADFKYIAFTNLDRDDTLDIWIISSSNEIKLIMDDLKR